MIGDNSPLSTTSSMGSKRHPLLAPDTSAPPVLLSWSRGFEVLIGNGDNGESDRFNFEVAEPEMSGCTST